MKKFSILLCLGAAVLSLASCNREQLVPDGLYTITASREGDAATKTYVDDGLSLVWASEDKIGVFNGDNVNVGYTLSSGQGTGSAEFTADTPFAEGKLYAYYPYSGDNKTSGSIVVDLSNQTYSEPSDFGKYFYMVGSADVKEGATDINIGFKNPLAAFVFTVDNNLDHAITVTGFSVSTLDREPVFHQEATLDLGDEDPTALTITDDAADEISVSIENIEVAAETELAFPLVVLPTDLTGKELYFTFSYISNEESKTVNKSVSGKTISRNTFITGTFTLEESTIGGDTEGYVSTAEELVSALASGDAQISVTFANNIEVSGGITLPSNVSLNLNGNKLTAQSIHAANDNSVIAITNGTVGFSGTGNGVELSAGNSTLTLDGVTLDASSLSGTAICSGSNDYPEWAGNMIVIRNSTVNAKAAGILLENAHNLTIENSTINHGYFGITQNGENPGSSITLKNCNISGTYSGIYLSNHATGAKNTLKVEGGTILSEEESAIEVKKTDISVTGATLSSVASEQTYSVNGSGSSGTGYGIVLAGYVVGTPYEGETSFTNNTFILAAGENAVGILRYDGEKGAAVISSNEELAAAAIADNSTIYLTKGEYVIPAAAKGKTVTFIGTGNPEDVNVTVTAPGSGENCDYGLDGSNATFDGITITTNSTTYTGYARCNGTYKNCIINGTYTLYGESIFDNCEFNVSGDVYNIWTWGAEEIKFTECTFNSDGKALLLYREDGGTVNLTVTDCTFNDNDGLENAMKAAIEIGDSPYDDKPTYNVTVSNTSVNGYAINNEGISTGTTLWGNKNSMPKDRLNVTVDGKVAY
ncbi:MAG: fimbrillin family protein [Candidatus Phocaeicola excrementipullorum]|uniref:Fimbrillin family protein n=1 Tax=Candidatus Phocaeicola excrementipullorum TaxID=2838731 RepID=A0A948TKU8_9BACT|nr:fimbrillin family protein [Candidatus Phocaeicola excrementipullorum]